MKEVPYHNKTDHFVHIGRTRVPPGETRMVDESHLPDAHERMRKPEPKSASTGTGEPQKPMGSKDLIASIPGLSADELDAAEAAENALEKPRKTVLSVIAAERIKRASDASQDLIASIPGLSADELDAAEAAENALDEPREDVLQAIADERTKRDSAE